MWFSEVAITERLFETLSANFGSIVTHTANALLHSVVAGTKDICYLAFYSFGIKKKKNRIF